MSGVHMGSMFSYTDPVNATHLRSLVTIDSTNSRIVLPTTLTGFPETIQKSSPYAHR